MVTYNGERCGYGVDFLTVVSDGLWKPLLKVLWIDVGTEFYVSLTACLCVCICVCVEPGGLDPVLSRWTGIKSSTSCCRVTTWDGKRPRQDPQLGRGGCKHWQTHPHTTDLYEYNKDCTVICCWKSKLLTTYLQCWVAVLLKVRCYIERLLPFKSMLQHYLLRKVTCQSLSLPSCFLKEKFKLT